MTAVVYVALGSNLGDRGGYLARARAALAALPRTRVAGASTVEETAPLGDVPQGAYLNQMLRLETALEPEALLAAAQAIERDAGRVRTPAARWAPRTLDIDVVLFGTRALATPTLHVPHPELAHRDFWQRELAELGVDWRAALDAAAACGAAA
ncbi:2-amino-4-hydroxy-6-hydroxymethyldihydropteridine diphosphokinase [Gemmatimonadetes bacterium T265]|nr:2-amino-4-hydroxy-6-hydroxymethyldihydropteridine diphosphokinase [Gemmatimonadetes bacterium T265]